MNGLTRLFHRYSLGEQENTKNEIVTLNLKTKIMAQKIINTKYTHIIYSCTCNPLSTTRLNNPGLDSLA